MVGSSFLLLTIPTGPISDGYLLSWSSALSQWVPSEPLSGLFQAAGDLSGFDDNQTVVGLQTIPISATPPTLNQVLQYNGSAWTPSAAGVFTAAGDLSGTSDSQTVIAIRNHSVSAAAPTSNQVFVWSGTAWTPTTLAAAQLPSLSGDTTGAVNSTAVVAIQGHAVSSSVPTSNQVFVWNGSSWTPTTLTATQLPSLSGDASGAINSTTVSAIQGKAVSVSAPSSNQVFVWSGSAWTPTTLSATQLPSLSGDVTGAVGSTIVVSVSGTGTTTDFGATGATASLGAFEYKLGGAGKQVISGINTINTASNSATDILVFTPPNNSIQSWSVSIIGMNVAGGTPNGDYYRADFTFDVSNISSTVTLNPTSPAPQNVRSSGGGSSVSISVSIISSILHVKVTGITSTSYDWSAICQVQEIN